MIEPNRDIKRVVIVGGGTAGWMSAAALTSILGNTGLSVTLIESDAIGTGGVGEATLPHIRFFNQKLGIDEDDDMQEQAILFEQVIEHVKACVLTIHAEFGQKPVQEKAPTIH